VVERLLTATLCALCRAPGGMAAGELLSTNMLQARGLRVGLTER
jgi:hypothetical protein